MVGAHLDSVGTGPGSNDNGSGSAAILEIAEQLRGVFPKNKIRFIWFSAEESGLLGSEAYVDSLPQSERSKIAAMLNFDMIGSPNFVNFVYDGDLSDSPPIDEDVFAPEARPFSATIEKIFLDYFKSQRIPNEPTDFDGRSDYGPFIAAGIPAGGLFTGAEGSRRRAGRDLRRHGRRAVRPVLPPRLRQLLQQLQPGAGPVNSDAAAHTLITVAQMKIPDRAAPAPAPTAAAPCGRPRAWPRAAGLRGAGRRRRCSSLSPGRPRTGPAVTLRAWPRGASSSRAARPASGAPRRRGWPRAAGPSTRPRAGPRRWPTWRRRVPDAGARRHRRGVDAARRSTPSRAASACSINNAGYIAVGRVGDAADGVGPAPVRDERVRAAADVPARAAGDARGRRGHDRQRQLDGRAADVPGRRRLPRDQVRRRGAERRAADGGRALRDRRHLRRAGADPDRVRRDRGGRRRRDDGPYAEFNAAVARSTARSTRARCRGSAAMPTTSRRRSSARWASAARRRACRSRRPRAMLMGLRRVLPDRAWDRVVGSAFR